jgi:hypothetical protein
LGLAPTFSIPDAASMSEPVTTLPPNLSWHGFLRRYVAAILLLNLIWEFAQLPLYTLWREGSVMARIYGPLHCTVGDVMIASLALMAALLILGNSRWPQSRYAAVATASICLGLAYTGYSEWVNVYVRKSWGYSDLMPTIAGIGLSPLLQWLVIPSAIFAFLSNRAQQHS